MLTWDGAVEYWTNQDLTESPMLVLSNGDKLILGPDGISLYDIEVSWRSIVDALTAPVEPDALVA